MERPTRTWRAFGVLWLALFFVFWGICRGETEGGEVGGGAGPTSDAQGRQGTFTKGPYIQNLGPRSVTIKWETKARPDSGVRYKATGEETWKQAGNGPARILHEAELVDLTPGTEYAYVTDFRSDQWGYAESGTARFRTPVEHPKELRFVAYGDTRSQPGEHAGVIDAILGREDGKIDFVVHTGDLVNDGRVYSQWGSEFFGPTKELMRCVPLYPVLGNHEHNSEYYFDLFALPGNERFYSRDFGPALISFLDSNWPMTPDSEQYKWLEAELAACKAPWKFVVCHHPPFTSGPHGALDEEGRPKESQIRNLQDHIVPLLEKYGVTMVLAGHDHLYERSERGGISYITTGGGGGPLYEAEQGGKQNPHSKVIENTKHHYCVIKVDAERLRISAIGVDGSLIDEVEITAGAMAGAGRGM